jgi:hypothetical protein
MIGEFAKLARRSSVLRGGKSGSGKKQCGSEGEGSSTVPKPCMEARNGPRAKRQPMESGHNYGKLRLGRNRSTRVPRLAGPGVIRRDYLGANSIAASGCSGGPDQSCIDPVLARRGLCRVGQSVSKNRDNRRIFT